MKKSHEKTKVIVSPKGHPGELGIPEIKRRIKRLHERINELLIFECYEVDDVRKRICESRKFGELIENESEPALNLDMEILAEVVEIIFNTKARAAEVQETLFDEAKRLNELLERSGRIIDKIVSGGVPMLYFAQYPPTLTPEASLQNYERLHKVSSSLMRWYTHKRKSTENSKELH